MSNCVKSNCVHGTSLANFCDLCPNSVREIEVILPKPLPFLSGTPYPFELDNSEARACPCLYGSPCDPGMTGCTCINPGSSGGCLRCCSYGSLEQQRMRAEYLITQEKEIETLRAQLANAQKLPNGWPQPTFLNVDEEGALNIEWIIDNPDTRILFVYDPKEGPMTCITPRIGAQTFKEGSEAIDFLRLKMDGIMIESIPSMEVQRDFYSRVMQWWRGDNK